MSEQDGPAAGREHRRAPPWDADGRSRPRARASSPCWLPTATALRRVGRVGGLGRGEQIYAVRFIGDAGYVVTFRQIDPLYVLDLPTHRPARRAS